MINRTIGVDSQEGGITNSPVKALHEGTSPPSELEATKAHVNQTETRDEGLEERTTRPVVNGATPTVFPRKDGIEVPCNEPWGRGRRGNGLQILPKKFAQPGLRASVDGREHEGHMEHGTLNLHMNELEGVVKDINCHIIIP